MPHLKDIIEIAVAVLLVLLNGFFVAAEFALAKVREPNLLAFRPQDGGVRAT